MIVTLTVNPSVDRTIEVAALRPGTVIRAVASRVDAGGKGVNVARALAAHGYKARAVLPSGGVEGTQLQALLADSGIDLLTVPIAGSVRSNVTVVDADGTTTKLNEPGPRLRRAELEALASTLSDAAAEADWVVLSGSLAPGAPADWYARLTRRLRAAGLRVAIDSSGTPLAKAIAAGPDLVKPNREELAELSGGRIDTVADVIGAAGLLTARGVGTVLTSLGPAGAVLARRGAAWHATAAATEPRSTVGAGDALLAGYLAADAGGPAALAEAVAWGSAAAALPGSRMPGPGDIVRAGIRITDLTDPGSGGIAARRLHKEQS
ncbi:MAG TPA: 1-phosphofructokinase [Streptosporangiaceae bacterium]|nr:1-phosphofructokinase [Streptosporangiaceae bacterium]